jgi:hypothetical protein
MTKISEHLGDVEVVVIGEESHDKLRLLRDLGNYPFRFLKLDQPFNAIGIHTIPTTYLINDKGEIRKKITGSIDWLDNSTREHLLRTLEQ